MLALARKRDFGAHFAQIMSQVTIGPLPSDYLSHSKLVQANDRAIERASERVGDRVALGAQRGRSRMRTRVRGAPTRKEAADAKRARERGSLLSSPECAP